MSAFLAPLVYLVGVCGQHLGLHFRSAALCTMVACVMLDTVVTLAWYSPKLLSNAQETLDGYPSLMLLPHTLLLNVGLQVKQPM
ncbi:hypothetical protein V8C86DRAFT_2563833 [Haematococcus lacustris]